MSGPNHIVGGIVFTGIYLSMWDRNIYGQLHYLAFTAFFSVLPDIDHTKSLIGKSFYPIAKWLDRKFGHRTITHSLACYIGLAILIGSFERSYFNSNEISRIFLWAYGSHLIFDMMTIQGVPIFYPFKKNPCVIPGNPKFRFRSSDIKAESIIFLIFISLAFTCKDLFAKGFWNTYNTSFNTLKHLHNESIQYNKALSVTYKFTNLGNALSGKGWLLQSTVEKALLFEPGKGFINITNNDKIEILQPERTQTTFRHQELQFSAITLDSLNQLLKGKPIANLKIQSTLPIQYTKENKPQSGTSIELEHVFNPVLLSSDIDSIDQSTQRDIDLTTLEIERTRQEQAKYQAEKSTALAALQQVESDLESNELAIRENATRKYPTIKAHYEAIQPPVSNLKALQTRLQYQQARLHIRKSQSISGYISYFIIQIPPQ